MFSSLYALVIGFPGRGGGGGPRAEVGTLRIVHFKVLVFPHPWGIFFLQSPQYLAKPSTQLDLKMHFRTLFCFFERLAKTRTLHSDENWTLITSFLEYYIGCLQSGENCNFSFRPEFPRSCFKSLRTDEEQGKTHYHDGSLLLLNTTFLSFLSTLNGCCDASEISILVNI